MKTNNQMNHGGKLKEEYQDTWAEYYCKYIKFYEEDGVPILGISVQNEPEAVQTWDSCIYSGEEERDFIKNFLGPALEKNKYLDKKLVIWDHNRDVMVRRSRAVLSDPDAAKYVWGTGFHWYNGDHFDAVQKVHDEFPDVIASVVCRRRFRVGTIDVCVHLCVRDWILIQRPRVVCGSPTSS